MWVDGHESLTADDMPDLLCGPVFLNLPTDMIENSRGLLLSKRLKDHIDYRGFYKLVEDILSVKENEERER
ncbi:unnamed protein product [Macrosiphum euphorbiae]|uniref:Uncharacterized protein n=1 Tax=Macrosiphum euphorbiae TaxID=13131 RepID=A0AAV0VLV9_9HEMI|nr:unnamed protein product [Macrosiphum euphorbiae]